MSKGFHSRVLESHGPLACPALSRGQLGRASGAEWRCLASVLAAVEELPTGLLDTAHGGVDRLARPVGQVDAEVLIAALVASIHNDCHV